VRTLGAQSLLRVRSDGRLDAYHDRVRESVAERIDARRLPELHGALVEALQRSGPVQPDWLAAHALSAGLIEVGLAATLEAAGEAMHKLAFEHAATHLRTALSLLDRHDPRHDDALVRLAEALRFEGHAREAGDAYVQAAARAEGAQRLERLRQASAMYLGAGYADRGIEVMLPVLGTLGLSFPRSAPGVRLATLYELSRVHLLRPRSHELDEAAIDPATLARIDACYTLGTNLLSMQERGRTALFLLRGLRLGLQAGAARRAAYIEVAIASIPSGPHQLETRSNAVFEHGYRLARRHGDKALEGWTHTCHAMGGVYATLPALAIEQAWLAKRCLDAAGTFGGLAVSGAELALHVALMMAGRIDELAAATAEHQRRGRARHDLFRWAGARTYGALAFLAADQPERALAELSEMFDGWSTGEHWQRWRTQAGPWQNATHALLLQTWTRTYLADGAGALAALRASWPELRRHGYLNNACWRILLFSARGAAALAAAQAARSPRPLLRDVRRSRAALLRTRTQPVARSFSQLLAAGLAAISGDRRAAREALRAAAAAFDALHMQSFAAAAQRRLGELTEGEPGKRLRDAADARMRALGVASPQRWAAMHAPGFEGAQS
jgi:hypothetical protein